MTWLDKTPQCVVEAHVDMMERLMSEEAMSAATVASVGRGTKLGAWIGRQWHRWSMLSRGSAPLAKASESDLASAGIKVRVVEKRRDG